jgi:hypothetical protein
MINMSSFKRSNNKYSGTVFYLIGNSKSLALYDDNLSIFLIYITVNFTLINSLQKQCNILVPFWGKLFLYKKYIRINK